MDSKYWTYKDGKMIEIPPIKEICVSLEKKFLDQEKENERLREENSKLKEGIWKEEEVARLKEEYERMRKENLRGFPISEEEYQRIKEWRNTHKCKYRGLKIGSSYHYEFAPTSVGTFGTIICSCGEKFTFQEA